MTVNADTVDTDIERVLDGATGEFRDGLSTGADKMRQGTVAEGKQTEATVTGAGVESFSTDEAVVLVSLTTKTTYSTNEPRRDAVQRLQITVVRSGDGYKTSAVEFVD